MEGAAPCFDRTARCETCGLKWIESFAMVDAYAIDLRDSRVKSARVLNLTIKHNQPGGRAPPDAAA